MTNSMIHHYEIHSGVSFQKGNGNMQLFIFEYNFGCKIESGSFGSLPGRELIYTQYP